MTCRETCEFLSARTDDPQLDPSSAVQAHLESCAECRRAEEEYRRLDAELTEIYAPAKAATMPSVVATVTARIAAEPRVLPARGKTWYFSVAALLAVAVSGWLLWRMSLSTPPSQNIATTSGEKSLPVPADRPAEFKLDGATLWVRGGSVLVQLESRRVAVKSGAAVFHVEKGRGPFAVEVPGGSVSVLGTEFSVRTDAGSTPGAPGATSTRVSLRAGAVRLEKDGAVLDLLPGQTADLKLEPTATPLLLSGVTYPAETIWRTWDSLAQDERAERLDYLKAELSEEDYDVRLAARKHLAATEEDGLQAAREWTKSIVPRLRLESVLFLRNAPHGCPKSTEALHQVQKNPKEQPSIRQQAEESLKVLGKELK